MFRLKTSSTSPVHVSPSVAAHPWDEDQERVMSTGAQFPVKYLGVVPVSGPRGVDVCQKAVKNLPYGRNKKRMQLNISVEGIRAVDLSSMGLVIDQPIHKISFCSPDPSNDRIFSYICREGSTKRWLCYVFVAFKGFSGERLSHAMGCAFSAKLRQKKSEEKEFQKKKKKTSTGKAGVESSSKAEGSEGSPLQVDKLRQLHKQRQKTAASPTVDQYERIKMESFESLESLEHLGVSSSDHSFDDQLDEIVSTRTTNHDQVTALPRDASTDVLLLQERPDQVTSAWSNNFNHSNSNTMNAWERTDVAVPTCQHRAMNQQAPHKSISTCPIVEDSDDVNGLSFEQELDGIVQSRSNPEPQNQDDWTASYQVEMIVPPNQDTNPFGTFKEVSSSRVNVAPSNTVAMKTSRKQSDGLLLQKPPSKARPRPSVRNSTTIAPPTHQATPTNNMAVPAPSKAQTNALDIQDDDDFIAMLERELEFAPQSRPQQSTPLKAEFPPSDDSLGYQTKPVMLQPEQPTHWTTPPSGSGGTSARWPF